jgi:hypothetical protein
MPTSWPALFADVDRMELSRRRLLAAQAEFEAWALGAEARALSYAHAVTLLRAGELYRHTSVQVVVDAPPRNVSHRLNASHRRVGVALGASRVDLYSAREPGSAPCLHLGIQRAATSTRTPVFTTLPGALLVRRPDDGFDALRLPVPTDGRDCPRTTIDWLVFRAFELLVGTHRSTLT